MNYKHIGEIIENSCLNTAKKRIIKRYMEKQIARTQSIHSVRNKVYLCVQMLTEFKDKELEEFREESTFNSYITLLKRRGLKDSTIGHTKIIIKGFLIWYFDENVPKYLMDIDFKKVRKELLEAELLSPSEIKKIVSKSDNLRDKALIITLYESATRISELLNIKIKDIEFNEQETILKVTVSKTQKRKIPLFDSTPFLLNWINNHPDKDNPEAYAFISFASNHYGNMIQATSVGSMLKTYAKRAKINKHIYCHLLRHSRISWWAKVEKLNERDLRILAGWSERSDMPNTYIHYGIDGVLEKMKLHRGLLNTENLVLEGEKHALKPISCPRCNKVNPADSSFCNCGMALSINAHLKLQEIKLKEEELHQQLMTKNFKGIENDSQLDLKEMMYQVLKNDPELIEKLRDIFHNVEKLKEVSE